MLLGAQVTAGWAVGFTIGTLVVLVVAVLVIALIVLASSIRSRAADAHTALERAEQATASLHGVDKLNDCAVRVLEGAKTARRALTGK